MRPTRIIVTAYEYRWVRYEEVNERGSEGWRIVPGISDGDYLLMERGL